METVKVYFLHADSIRGREEALFSLLPPSRVEKAKRFVKEEDRLLSLAAGYLAHRFVGEYTTDENGKPRAKKVYFSLAHSYEIAALAIWEKGEIGIDLEKDRKEGDEEALAAYCLNEEEKEAYDQGARFLSLFTAKESLAKTEGSGLKTDLKAIPALPLSGEVEYKNKRYFRHTLLSDGYFISVTAQGEDFRLEKESVSLVF